MTKVYQFGPFRIDMQEQRLLSDGKAVPLTPKTFDLLRVLVENSGRLLHKEELLRLVWFAGPKPNKLSVHTVDRCLRGSGVRVGRELVTADGSMDLYFDPDFGGNRARLTKTDD